MVRQGIPQVPEQMAKEIRIQTRPVKSSIALSRKYHRDFLEALRLLQKGIPNPGSRYHCYHRGRNHVSTLVFGRLKELNCELAGSDILTPTGPHEPPLMKWMKDMSRMFLPSANHTSNR